LIASPGLAQTPVTDGFGQRDSFVLSAEQLLGFQTQETKTEQDNGPDQSTSVDSVGMHPIFWESIGLFGMQSTGLTFGAVVGVSYLPAKSDSSDSAVKLTLVRLRPRIG